MSEQLDVLRIVTERLDAAGIRYMVTGSIALSFYAEPRMTRDVDLVVELSQDAVPHLVEAFRDDFYLDEQTLREEVGRQGMFNLIHSTLIAKIDFIVRKDTIYRQTEFGRRRTVRIDSIAVSIVSPEDLLLSKLAWAKDRHSELQDRDVRSLIRSVTDLDWAYLERWASELDVDDRLREVRP